MTNGTAVERSLLYPRCESLIDLATEFAERGWFPDALVRAGIRSFVRERLSEQRRIQSNASSLASQLRSMPVAVEVTAANQQHYEVPPEFFARVLGPRLKYSCGYWPPDGVKTLAEAENAMLERTLACAGVEDGMEVLDLGCGWGSFALWLAERQPRTRVLAVSNSRAQGAYICRRAAARGLRNVVVQTADINRLLLPARFDRIVSVEMLEHVRNYEILFRRIRGWLAPEGRLFAHIFCHREHGYLFESDGASNWMARNFFTGGTMPSADLFSHFDDALVIEKSWWIDGTHYARTAQAWLDNLDAASAELTDLLAGVDPAGDGERALQRWRLFFLACAEMFGFAGGEEWGVGHYRMVRA